MSKSKLKIRRLIDPVIVILACASLYCIYYFQAGINTFFSAPASQSFPLKLIGPSVLLAIAFLLFRLFSSQVQHLASAQKRIVGIKSKQKPVLDSQIDALIINIERDQFSVIAQNVALIICCLAVSAIKPESTSVFICGLTVLMFAIIASLFNHYFQLTKLVRKIDLQVSQEVTESEKRSKLLESIKDDIIENPINDIDHLKGYTSLH